MKNRHRVISSVAMLMSALALGGAMLLLSSAALGAEPPTPNPPASPPTERPDATPPADEPKPDADGKDEGEKDDAGLPGLDELLGLPTKGQGAPDDESRKLMEELDPSKVELERKLTAQEAADKLASAVQQMEETAFRLEKVRDTGIATQRLQSEIIAKLDVLIKQAEQSSSSSSSSSSSQNQQPQMKPGDQQSQPAQQTPNQNQHTGEQNPGGLPGFQQNPGDQFDASRAAWGALPQRVRDKLIEGTSDYFSEFYKAMTEAYYKRLAEEASQ